MRNSLVSMRAVLAALGLVLAITRMAAAQQAPQPESFHKSRRGPAKVSAAFSIQSAFYSGLSNLLRPCMGQTQRYTRLGSRAHEHIVLPVGPHAPRFGAQFVQSGPHPRHLKTPVYIRMYRMRPGAVRGLPGHLRPRHGGSRTVQYDAV